MTDSFGVLDESVEHPDRAGAASKGIDDDRSRVRDLIFRIVVGLMVVVAIPLLMKQGQDQWFVWDEWDFLAERSLGDPGSIFRPHNEHLVALPAIAYRVVWQFVGLRSYVPYQLMAVISHAAVVLALVVVMRRAEVTRVLTVAAAAFMLFFGPGAQNIVWGFQITLTGALAFGLVQVILADHTGPWSRRDTLGLVSGTAAVLCTGGLGGAMVAAAALVAWIRRDWRAGLAHLVPLALLAGWMVAAQPDRVERQTLRVVFEHTLDLLGDTTSDIVHGNLVVGLGFLAVIAVGLILAGIESRQDLRRGRSVVPAVLAATAVGMAFVISIGRPTGGAFFGTTAGERHVYLLAALVLPAIAVAIDELARRWRPVSVVAVAAVVLILPSNYRAIALEGSELYGSGSPERVVALGHSQRLEGAPADLVPEPVLSRGMTAGFLRFAKSSGRLVEGDANDEAMNAWADFALTIRSEPIAPESLASYSCTEVIGDDPAISVQRGDILRLHVNEDQLEVAITKVDPTGIPAAVNYWSEPPDHRLDLEFFATHQVAVQPLDKVESITLCSPP